MKKLLTFVTSLIAVLACCLVAACGDKEPVEPLIITASDPSFSFEGKTLKEYMDYLQDNGEFTYTINNGMVTTINGKSNTTNSYWMLYTSDSENANTAWGTFGHEGNTYGSATSGVEALVVKKDCIYIWAYQTF